MPIVKSKIRNSSLKFCPIIILSLICLCVLYHNSEAINQVLIRDETSLLLMGFSITSVVTISAFSHLLYLYLIEYLSSEHNLTIFEYISGYLHSHQNLCYIMCLEVVELVIFSSSCLCTELKLRWDYTFVIIFAGILSSCITLMFDYDDVELSSSQSMKKSIGASWAHGAYNTFYKKILQDIARRMTKFEEKESITFLVKKLVIICPLSCNANGSLDGRHGDLKFHGVLEEVIEDDGAVNERRFKTNVFKINESFIAAEIPSPLATLYEMRDIMDSIILEYHRDCFIETLKDLTRSENCIILQYDDLASSPEPLHSFLLSKLGYNKIVME